MGHISTTGGPEFLDFDARTLIEAIELLAEKIEDPAHPLRASDNFGGTLLQSREFLLSAGAWLRQLAQLAPAAQKCALQPAAEKFEELLQPLWDAEVAMTLEPNALVAILRATLNVLRAVEQAIDEYFDPGFEPEAALSVFASMANELESRPFDYPAAAILAHRKHASELLRYTRSWLLHHNSQLVRAFPRLSPEPNAAELAGVFRSVATILRSCVARRVRDDVG